MEKMKDKLKKHSMNIDKIVEIVDAMEEHHITLMEILDEWYLRKIG